METMAHVVQKNTANVMWAVDFLDIVMLMERAFVRVLVLMVRVAVPPIVKIVVDQNLL